MNLPFDNVLAGKNYIILAVASDQFLRGLLRRKRPYLGFNETENGRDYSPN